MTTKHLSQTAFIGESPLRKPRISGRERLNQYWTGDKIGFLNGRLSLLTHTYYEGSGRHLTW